MNNKQKIPFQNLTKGGWINLGLAAVITVYVISIINVILKLTTCETVVIDYCAFWSAGRIISDHGIASAYDLNILSEVQRKIFVIPSGLPFQPFAILYLPIFLFPFYLISSVNLQISYVIWTLVNLIGLLLYLRYFAKKALSQSLPGRHLLLFLASLANFFNLYEGQVNLLMLIGVGGFIVCSFSDKPFQAGLWLGTLLIKPQFLILLVPFLVIQRKYKVLSGFFVSFLVVMIASFAMIGIEGFEKLLNVLIVSFEGGAFSNPWAQMNWRMIGQHLTLYISPILS